MGHLLMALSLFVAAPQPTLPAQPQAKEKGEEEVGIKVGEKAPQFKLKAQDGKDVTLKQLLKKDKVALVFFRSVGW